MPCRVDIAVTSPTGAGDSVDAPGPLDDASSRTFWCIGRTDNLAGDDRDT